MTIRKMRARREGWAILAVSSLLLLPPARVAGDGMFRLAGHVPSKKIHLASYVGAREASDVMKLAVVLKPRDQAGLDDFLRRAYDPADPLFHRFLTPADFAERFGADERDVDELSAHFERHGLRVSGVHANRLVLDLEGPTSAVEDAFQLQMGAYRMADGRVAYSGNADPIFPAAIASRVQTVAGLDGFAKREPRFAKGMRLGERTVGARVASDAEPHAGSRATVNDYFTPEKIKLAYGLNGLTQTGAGETLAMLEFDGYTASDITGYAAAFNLPAPNLENIFVDGAVGTPGENAIEPTLDLQLAAAVAPGLAKILVYQGPNTDDGALHTLSRIASDNRASVLSISWGLSEDESKPSTISGENTIFQQMAAQGISVFAASGDLGAYDMRTNAGTLAVDDPASQPFVTGVGGTTLELTTANTYKSESAWGDTSTRPRASGGGGGVSKVWGLPSWQASVSTNAQGHSTTHRMVPDVSLNANPGTGYPVYFQQPGEPSPWVLVGGTSAAAPLWAAFTTLVNQKRVADGRARIGYANPVLYQVAQSAQYPVAFHDVEDRTSNLKYGAVPDYDLATGWGSFQGTGMFSLLTGASLPAVLAAPSMPTNVRVEAN